MNNDYVTHKRDTEQYEAYIKTEQWQEIVQKRLKIDNYTCVGCGSRGTTNNPLTVHHLTYRNLYKENYNDSYYTDLVTLCYGCHTLLHTIMERTTNKYGRKGWSNRQDLPKITAYTITGELEIKKNAGVTNNDR